MSTDSISTWKIEYKNAFSCTVFRWLLSKKDCLNYYDREDYSNNSFIIGDTIRCFYHSNVEKDQELYYLLLTETICNIPEIYKEDFRKFIYELKDHFKVKWDVAEIKAKYMLSIYKKPTSIKSYVKLAAHILGRTEDMVISPYDNWNLSDLEDIISEYRIIL